MRLAALAMCTLLLVPILPAGAQTALLPEPIVLLDGRSIAACGVRVPGDVRGAPVVLEVMLARTKAGGDIVARLSASGGRTSDSFRLTTASQRSEQIFVGAPARDGGSIELRTSAASAAVTLLIQELMVSGAILEVTLEGGETGSIQIPGPMPQSVRAGYLNCAGDLFRPGE